MLLQSKLPGAGRLRVVTAGSLVGLFLIGTAHASGPPVGFDGYSVASGEITATPCASLSVPGAPGATITCSDTAAIAATGFNFDNAHDDGMYQRQITISGAGPAVDGTYVQFILTDTGVTGDPTANPFTAARGTVNFTNEDFVKMNNQVSGIASKQVIIQSSNPDPSTITTSTIEDRVVLATEYNFGWAQSNADPWVLITQDISQVDYSSGLATPTEIFSTNSMLENNSPPLQWHTNSKFRVDQRVDLTEAGQGAGAQGFMTEQGIAWFQEDILVNGPDGTPLIDLLNTINKRVEVGDRHQFSLESSFLLPLRLAAGQYHVRIRIRDRYGNMFGDAEKTFIVQ